MSEDNRDTPAVNTVIHGSGGDRIPLDQAIAALGLETPVRSAWPALATHLRTRQRRSRRRNLLALAAAASLALLALVPALRLTEPTRPAMDAGGETLAALMAESAVLEAQLEDDETLPLPAPIATISLEVEGQLRSVDALLSDPNTGATDLPELWRQRVALLHDLNRLQSARFELASRGHSLDAALVVAY